MPTRASDSSKFTRWDEDSLRGGTQTHPGIVENGVLATAVSRTNLGGAASRQEADFGSEGRGFESLRARQFLASILAHAPLSTAHEIRQIARAESQVPARAVV